MENRTEWLKKWFWKKFVRKGFSVELDAEYTFPFGKDSGKIDAAVIRTAIEKYCASSGDRLEFLAGENPVTFRLNGKETYTARVWLGHSRLNRGYYIKCQQIAEESKTV